MRQAGAPDEVAHGAPRVAAVPRADEGAGTRDPALRRIDAVERVMVEDAAFGCGNDRECRVLLAALQVVVAGWQPRKRDHAVSAEDAGCAGRIDGAAAPVGKRVFCPGDAADGSRPFPVGVDVSGGVKPDCRLQERGDGEHGGENDVAGVRCAKGFHASSL